MNTLASTPVSTLLTRLFAEASVADRDLGAALSALPPALRSPTTTEYRELYARAKDMFLPVSPETGALLYLLARARHARSVVEFGTSFGISTLHLAAAVRDNGGGRLLGTELEPTKAARARAHLDEAGLLDLVEIREGDALESLGRDLPDIIDLVLLDGAKLLYPRILSLLEARLGPGALVVADNAEMSPEYRARVRGEGYVSVAFGGDVEVSVRV